MWSWRSRVRAPSLTPRALDPIDRTTLMRMRSGFGLVDSTGRCNTSDGGAELDGCQVMRDAFAESVTTLPEQLRRSLSPLPQHGGRSHAHGPRGDDRPTTRSFDPTCRATLPPRRSISRRNSRGDRLLAQLGRVSGLTGNDGSFLARDSSAVGVHQTGATPIASGPLVQDSGLRFTNFSKMKGP